MLLDLQVDIFEASDDVPVITLLTMVAKERHEWRPSLGDALRAERFVQRVGAQTKIPAIKEWAAKAVVEAAQPRKKTGQEVVIAAENLDRAADELQKPAVLVVENRLADGGFFRDMAAALGDERVVRALHASWLRFCHGGGTGQMPELAFEESSEFSLLPPRVAIVFDSDRRAPGAPSAHDGKAERARRGGILHVHIFTLRMVENYIPFRVWEYHFPDQQEEISKLRQMPLSRRGYLHKKSFPGRLPRPLAPDGVDLTEVDFHELGEGVVAELRQILSMIRQIL
jgi:hypothetical protein